MFVDFIYSILKAAKYLCLDFRFQHVVAAIVASKGSDAWWYMTIEDLLPEKYRDKASEYEKGTDTMDVWFDSGLSLLLF